MSAEALQHRATALSGPVPLKTGPLPLTISCLVSGTLCTREAVANQAAARSPDKKQWALSRSGD